jgi:hypothetical protein
MSVSIAAMPRIATIFTALAELSQMVETLQITPVYLRLEA